ncbi:MAG: hypothetical protein U0519_02945 [Candidatus Gracilibacteria bacterium]
MHQIFDAFLCPGRKIKPNHHENDASNQEFSGFEDSNEAKGCGGCYVAGAGVGEE